MVEMVAFGNSWRIFTLGSDVTEDKSPIIPSQTMTSAFKSRHEAVVTVIFLLCIINMVPVSMAISPIRGVQQYRPMEDAGGSPARHLQVLGTSNKGMLVKRRFRCLGMASCGRKCYYYPKSGRTWCGK